jgi:hypothetical protein
MIVPNSPEVTQAMTFANVAAGLSPGSAPQVVSYKGRTYKLVMALRSYKSNGNCKYPRRLVDGGCNGGLAGEDV